MSSRSNRSNRRSGGSSADVEALLAALAENPKETQLRAALGHGHYRPVARAAELAADGLCYALEPELAAAFRRLAELDHKQDPGCMAKGAIVRALVALDAAETELFRTGIRLRQLEPVWGGSVDTAADVRASCAMGLAASTDPDVLRDLVDLLADPEPIARRGAVRAIGCTAPDTAEAVLRTKALLGDADAEVMGECFRVLLALAPDAAPEFVGRWLAADDPELRELAALALGESRLDAAVALLRARWEAEPFRGPHLHLLLRAAALARTESAFAWLLDLAECADSTSARRVIEELAIYRHHAQLAERLRSRLRDRGDADLFQVFDACWGRADGQGDGADL